MIQPTEFQSLKCCIVGSCGVGKTTIINKYLHKNTENTETTLGAIFWTFEHTTKNGNNLKLDFWDTAGQERYNSLIPMYSRNSDIVVLTYDIADKYSFRELDKWIKTVSQYNNTCDYIVIGNKIDKKIFRQIFEEDVNKFIKKYPKLNIKYIETSAKNGENISELFEIIFEIGNKRCKKMKKQENKNIIRHQRIISPKNSYKCCPIL